MTTPPTPNDLKYPSTLELASTQSLLDELGKRHKTVIFMGDLGAESATLPDRRTNLFWQGNPYDAVSLAARISHLLQHLLDSLEAVEDQE